MLSVSLYFNFVQRVWVPDHSDYIATAGRDVEEIVKDLDLEDVKDWEALAGWLNVSTQPIKENCIVTTTAVAQCHRRSLVATYCDLIGGDAERVKADIRHVLQIEMRIKKQG